MKVILIDIYFFIFDKELIDCWYNPFTTKMIIDLNIKFTPIIDDTFYINRYNENYKNILKLDESIYQ